MSMCSRCALSAVLLCFLVTRPSLAQQVDNPRGAAVRLDSGCLCLVQILHGISQALLGGELLSEHEQHARSLFLQAQRLHRAGQLEAAYVQFQEVHLHSPTSIYGQKAMEQIHKIETAFRIQNTAKPGISRVDFTIPLGTVDDVY